MSPLQVTFFDDHVLASQPNFIWKPWVGLGIWDLGPPGHCLPTWFSCGFHMAPTWFSCGFHMVSIPSIQSIPSIASIHPSQDISWYMN